MGKKQNEGKLPRKFRQRKPAPLALRIIGRILSFVGGIVCSVLAVIIITGCIVGVSLTTYVMSFADVEVDIDLYDIDQNFTTILYANDPDTGEQYELKRLQGDGNRVWVDLEDIPQHTIDALTSVEDERFYQHNGVDWKRTVGAFLNEYVLDLYGGTQGGSTITQQLVKNITNEDDIRIERKLVEIFTALELEKKYSKDDILEAYLNRVHFGNNTYGIEAAANLYFGKSAGELTIAESAAIVGITQYPAYYNPFVNPDANKERQEYVLYKMYELGKISKLEYDMARVETLQFVGSTSQSWSASMTWFEDSVFWEVLSDLQEQCGYSYSYAYDQLYNGGLRIETTLNQSVQDALDNVFVSGEIFPTQTGKEEPYGEPDTVQPEAAGVVMDYTGAIVGLSGGIGEKTQDLLFSRATTALRQNGSTMKPIGVYALAVEYNLITFSTVIEDAPIELKENGEIIQWPVNYYDGYLGNMTCSEALQRSCNAVAVRVGQMVTPERSFDFLHNTLHIESLVEREVSYGQVITDISLGPMNLGSTSHGMTLEDLVGAYQIFGNGGLYNKPHTYTRVLDHDGNVLLENNYQPQRALSEETAMVMNKMLQQVMYGPHGTGVSAAFSGQHLFGKTGTTSDNKDHWFVGGSAYYVAAVWWGYDIPQELIYTSYHPPMRAWRTFMAEIHENLPEKDYPTSDNVVSARYCNASGLLAGADCPEDQIYTGWYKKSNLPNTCNHSSLDLGGDDEEEGKNGLLGGDDDDDESEGGVVDDNWWPDGTGPTGGTGSDSGELVDPGAYPVD